MEKETSTIFNPLEWVEKTETIEDKAETTSQNLDQFAKLGIDNAKRIISESVDGQKHHALCKASYLLGGYVSGGIISESDAVSVLQNAISNKSNVFDLKLAFKTIDKSLQSGKKEPITIERIKQNRQKIFEKFNYQDFQKNEFLHQKSIITNHFPVEVFPDIIQEFIKSSEKIVGFSPDYLSASILYAVSVAIGNSAKIKVRSTQFESALLYIAIVGNAGANKSHPLKLAINPLVEIDSKNYEEFLAKQSEYKIEIENYNNTPTKERQDILKPEEAILKQILVSDTTIEALTEVHFYNLKGLGVYRDEILGWFNDLNKYKGKGSDEQFWLSTWNNTFVKVNRKSGIKHLFLKHPFISVIGTIQTALLSEILNGNRTVNGFIDRILFVMPENQEKQKFNDEEIPRYLIENYTNIIKKIFSIECEIIENQVKSKILKFADDAKIVFSDWYDYNAELINNEKNEQFKSVYSKLDMYVPRFALILQIMHWSCGYADNKEVELFALNGAIQLAEYFRNTAKQIRSVNKVDISDKIIAQKLSEKGYSLRHVAEIMGCSHSQVSNLLKN